MLHFFPDGSWFYGNCATPQSFVCEKALQTPTLAPPPVAGYCPRGYFGLGKAINHKYVIVYFSHNRQGWSIFTE